MRRLPDLVWLEVVAVLSVLGVVALAAWVLSGGADAFDAAVLAWLAVAHDESPRGVLRPITELGSTWAITAVALLILAFFALRRRPRLGLLAAGTIALTALTNTNLKTLLARSRPEALDALLEEHGFSFPSGHALLSATTYGILIVLIARSAPSRPLRWLPIIGLLLLIGLIGISRVYVGVHHPTDVLAGWLIGLAITLFFARLTRGRVTAPPVDAAVASPPGEEQATP